MATTTVDDTVQKALDQGSLTDLGNGVHKVKLGTMAALVQATFTSLVSLAAQVVTNADHKAKGVVVGIGPLGSGVNLPPIGTPVSVRVTAGAAAAGIRAIADAGATPSTTLATLSQDGTTLTFEDAVTGYVLLYRPGVAVPLTTKFAPSA